MKRPGAGLGKPLDVSAAEGAEGGGKDALARMWRVFEGADPLRWRRVGIVGLPYAF